MWFVAIIVGIAWGYVNSAIARARGRPGSRWFWLSLLCAPLVTLYVLAVPVSRLDPTTEKPEVVRARLAMAERARREP